PEYTGEGIMSRLMKKSLLRMKEKGQSLALLYPYSIPLYRKFGWEIISSKISYQIMDRQIPANRTAEGKVQRVDWENEDFM
ncbi:GNAT family N-acetyltransferase, partial [Enterococcus sp. S181_ASV_20]|nr:GNAT family N-acetyltransferase [Enterococcus sp. S181_ASV_20]